MATGVRCTIVSALLLCLAAISATANAQCPSNEMTAVFIVSGIYPGTNLQLETLAVSPLGEVTTPSDSEIIASIMQVQPMQFYSRLEQVGSLFQYYASAADAGGVALVDSRDGAIPFAGTVIWMGRGDVTVPAESSHSWSLIPGTFGPAPAGIGLMSNHDWPSGEQYGTPDQITASALTLLRQTDVLQSFGACGPYSVVSYIYTPAVGATIPEYARCVVIVSGTCGPPWNGGLVVEEGLSWGAVKGLYR